MTLGTLLGSGVLAVSQVAAIGVLTVSATAAVLLMTGRRLHLADSVAMMMFTAMVSALTVAVTRHRLRLEQERERRIRDSQARYRVLFESAPIGIGPIDATGRFIEANQLITDLIMPGINGRQVADQITALRPAIRVLYTSGYMADVMASHGVLEDGVEFLPKPYAIAQLAQKARTGIASKTRRAFVRPLR